MFLSQCRVTKQDLIVFWHHKHLNLNEQVKMSNMPKKKKLKITITIDPDLIKWIDAQIEQKNFASRSHGIEFAIAREKERQERR